MDSKPTPFDTDAPETRRAIIRRNPDDLSEVEMIEAVWGSDPRFGGGASYRFVRAEGQALANNRCLIAASEFQMTKRDKRYRVTLDDGNFFYLAAIWEPAMADWPISYRIVTVEANPDVSPYQERHGAIVQRRQVMHWLDATADEELLNPLPAGTFCITEIPLQTELSW
jgi:putative SOS response-associated peptidase YedK